MRHALSLTDDSVDRFVVIQGSDYPIVPFNRILSFFDSARGVNFINACTVEDCDNGEMNKYRITHDLKDRSFVGRIARRVKLGIASFQPKLVWRKPPYVRIDGDVDMTLFSGWAQFSVTREVVEFFVSFHDTHPEFNEYFESVYAADESYFHTIFYNSRFAESASMPPIHAREGQLLLNNTYFEYPDQVREWTLPEEHTELLKSGKLFFRKVDSERGRGLLDYIDLRNKVG